MGIAEFYQLPTTGEALSVLARIVTAAALGALLGEERQRAGKAAGLRTHMLVSLGSALFMLFPAQSGMQPAELSRIAQGVAAGIGFLGAGTILKRTDPEEVHGLTTAASIWLTSAIGLAVGAGRLWLPTLCAVCAWLILSVLARFEKVTDKA